MMQESRIRDILNLIESFAESHSEILAVGLCGSWARGTATPQSDIDLSIIVRDKSKFKASTWLYDLNFNILKDSIEHYKDKSYGKVWSRHVYLKSKTEIEFSFANPSWANTKPVDAGTRQVVADGYKIIYDPFSILEQLLKAVNP